MPRATLSDLLAADVQDYFRREGVNESTKSNERQKTIDRQSGRRRRRPAVNDDNPGASAATSGNAEGVSNDASNHGRRLSNGSDSKHSFMTAQDAEFLKRYALERDRALRMNIRDRNVNEAAPKELVDKDCINLKPSGPSSPRRRSNIGDSNQTNKGSPLRPYQTLAASPRPPSVTGSHRPQLASINNDDWEEDDRLEQKELRRKERHLRKKSNASRMSNGSIGGHWRMHSSNGSVGNGSFVRQMIQQSDSPTRSYVRKGSEDTFIRQYDPFHSSYYGNAEYNHNGHHTRPPSYLSASSESEQKSEVNTSSHGPSPLSSGTFKTLPSDRYSFRSKDESEVSALWGGSIMESSSPGSDKPQQQFYRTHIGYRQESSEYSDEDYTSTSDESSDSSVHKDVRFSEADKLLPRHKSYSSIPRQHNKRPKVSPLRLDAALKVIWDKLWHGFVLVELYISNMPSLVGSLALAWSSLGVDWFKWYEETFDACHPTDYHNKLCIYPEFPGCFTCDTTRIGYQLAINFHYLCSVVSFVLALSLILKIIIAFPVVRDELANPTTAAPLGLLCMAVEKIFGGNFGIIGRSFVFGASALQTAVAVWFIFISIVYKTLPEPSWFPNTTGLGLAAAKIFLYWTAGGYVLSGLSILLFLMFYFVALYRIHANYKISAPVCWVQLSGPAVVLYGTSIFGQPGNDEAEIELASSEENIEHFTMVHRKYYMPFMHFFFSCCLLSMGSALYCLSVRFRRFREKEFSPAHVAFCAPLLSYANALQVYRSAVKRFTMLPYEHVFKMFLYQYWTLCLTSGTVLLIIMTWKFVRHLPNWCRITIDDDEIPPEPEDTILTKLLENGNAKDEITQDYVSAAVIQANESGALMRVLRDGRMKYVRSRRMPSMGFDPIMSSLQLLNERERLLQHVKYEASLRDRERGTNSFDDTLSSFYERTTSRTSSISTQSSGRNRRNFMSFDASAMMRGDH